MPRNSWSDKRERQYEHIKEGELRLGRTVNKERARVGESTSASRNSTEDISSGRRGGLRSRRGTGVRTYSQLYAEAQRKNISGRSKMKKDELQRAIDHC